MNQETAAFDGSAGKRNWGRRRFIAGLGGGAAVLLAGCIGGDSGTDDGDSDEGTDTGGSDNGGDDDSPGQGVGEIGQVVSGNSVSFAVEYVRPVTEILDFSSFPRTSDTESYGIPRTVDYYSDQGFVSPAASFYRVGMAIKNTSDSTVDASTIVLRSTDSDDIGIVRFPSRSQKLTFQHSGRSSGNPVVPGELMRGELVFALLADPSNYVLEFTPFGAQSGFEQLSVDLSRGSEAGAPFTQAAPHEPLGQPVAVGDFEVTLHGVDRVPSIEDSPHQDIFGPREGYDYLRIDLSATRRSEEMIGAAWSMGVSDDEGHFFTWGTVYQDVLDLNRTRLEQLSTGESLSNVILAFPVETDFDPTALTMTGMGPIENPPRIGAKKEIQRVFWPLG